MPDTVVKIMHKSNNRLEPESGFRVQVGSQDAVKFTTEPGVVGLNITFLGDSPFGPGKQTVPYETRLPLVVTFDAQTTRKTFRFRCEAMINGKKVVGADDGGGEMEVIRAGANT